MPAAARSGGIDKVFSKTGLGRGCKFPNPNVVTGAGSCEVYINGYKAVREGDQVGSHAFIGCGPDNSTLTSFSSTVFIGGTGGPKGVGRIGDQYGSDNIITRGSSTVFIGG